MTRSKFRVEELDCATEENELRRVLGQMDGVRSLEFNLVARQAPVSHTLASPAPIEAAIRAAGMRPKLLIEKPAAEVADRSLPLTTRVVTGVAGLLAISSEAAVIAGAKEQSVLVGILAGLSIALGGRDTLRKGWQSLISRRLSIALLMSVAVVGAIVIGQWPEAAVVIWLFGVAELIEALSLERARNAIRSLVVLGPETALVRTTDSGWATVGASTVHLGDVVQVKPGERIPSMEQSRSATQR